MRILIILSTLLVACDQQQNPTRLQMQTPVPVENAPGYVIKRVATFGDDLAYGKNRGVYEITDLSTGTVYVGISGIGIAEKGSHMMGKQPRSDER